MGEDSHGFFSFDNPNNNSIGEQDVSWSEGMTLER